MAFKRSSAWSDDPRFAHTQHMVEVCPPELMPTVRQNMASGGLAIDWPEVCRCPVNGGATHEVHALAANCVVSTGEVDLCNCNGGQRNPNINSSKWLTGDTEPSKHVVGCPFDTCPLGTCHPMCSQTNLNTEGLFCNCACHG